MRLDTTYYFWPPGWVQDRPGLFTGSAMAMRFADLDGTLINVYNAPTQMTDESGQTLSVHDRHLVERRCRAPGLLRCLYSKFPHGHCDEPGLGCGAYPSAIARGVPVVSSAQMLTWLDGRNSSSFSGIAWNGSTLTFSCNTGDRRKRTASYGSEKFCGRSAFWYHRSWRR